MATLPAVNENTRQVVDNVRNYTSIFFSTLLNRIYLPHISVGCHVYMQKTTCLKFYANTYFCIMHMKQQLS